MSLDFSVVLVTAVVVTGTILLVDKITSASHRGAAGGDGSMRFFGIRRCDAMEATT